MDFLTFFDNDFKILMPELYLFTATLILLSYGVIYSTSRMLDYPIIQLNVGWLSIFSLTITLFLYLGTPVTTMSAFNDLLIIDSFSSFMKILIVISSIVCCLMSLTYLENKKVNSFEYFILILLATIGMLCLVSTNDLLALYMSIELMSLSFYILAAYKRNSEFSGEAGLKYFILGAFSSGLLLFGMSLIYGFTGLTNFEELAKVLTGINAMSDSVSYNGILIGLLFITVSLLFKVAAAPFHMWSPDVYEGAPTPVTAFFSIVPKMAIFALLIRIFYSTFYDFLGFWQPIFLYTGILSMIVGSLGALYQKKIKRLMAYSGIANVGYMLIGLAAGTVESMSGLVLYLLIYVVMTTGFFSFVLGTQTEKDSKLNTYIADLDNLGKVNPALAFAVTFIIFSMVGLPPFAGFFGKFYLFLAAMQSELYTAAIIGVLSSVVAAFYYIRIIKLMFFGTSSIYTTYKPMDKANALILSASIFFLIFFFAYPHPFLMCIHKASLSLML
jgi:proton-translocating NADH-quinone oxidoreductase chain N